MEDFVLKEHAARCCSLADKADEFTKKRLLDLAASYDSRMSLPSRASSVITARINLPGIPAEHLCVPET
jgi:hypothetical protein